MTLIAACPSEQAYLEEKTKNKPTIKQQLKFFIQELQIKGNSPSAPSGSTNLMPKTIIFLSDSFGIFYPKKSVLDHKSIIVQASSNGLGL